MRWLAALLLVVGVVARADGAPSMAVRAEPEVSVVHVSGAGGTTGTVTLVNSGTSDVTIASLTRDPACDSDVTAVLTTPVTIAAGGGAPVTLHCAGTVTTGMRRCVFHANSSPGDDLVDFEAVCEGGTVSSLTAAPAAIDFGDVTIGGAASTAVTVSTSGAAIVAKLFLQTTDLGGNFEVGAPCNPDARECDGSITGITAGGSAVISVWCRPKTVGPHTATLRIASETGAYLGAPVTLACMATPSAGPALVITGDPIDAGNIAVQMGMAKPRSLHVRNAGATPLTLTSVQILGAGGAAADWSYVASGACTGTIPQPCMLAPTDHIDLELRFDPSAIGSRSAALIIGYFDGVARSRAIPLTGTGTGATLAIVGVLTPLEFGTVPINQTSNLAFALGNLGNRSTTATLTATPPGAPFSLTPPSTIVVAPGTPAMVGVACHPTASGDAQTSVSITADDALVATSLALTARCTGTTGPLFTDPAAIALGEIRTSVGVTQVPITIQSTGPALQITNATLATTNANLSVVGAFPIGTPAALALSIDPQTAGPLSDELVVSASSGQTVHVPISGTVVTATYAPPLARSLGTFCVKQPTTADELALRSTGTATLMLGTPTLAAGAFSPFDLELRSPTVYPSLLPAASIATIGITPKRAMSAGIVQDEVVWTTDVAGDLTARTMVSAQFVDDGGAIAPSALSFGAAVIHLDTFNAQRVTLQNCDTQTIFFGPPDVPPPFRLDSDGFPLQLAPNERATFSVGFHPTRRGVFEATLVIESDQLETALELHLGGEGVVDSPAMPDAGPDPRNTDERSFYGCSCDSNRAGGAADGSALAILFAVALALSGRRRSGSS